VFPDEVKNESHTNSQCIFVYYEEIKREINRKKSGILDGVYLFIVKR
jgi:hypothetical protein